MIRRSVNLILVLGIFLYQINRYFLSKVHLLPKKNKISMKIEKVFMENRDRILFELVSNDDETNNER